MTWDIKWTQCWRGPNKLSTRWADLCCCWANCIQKKSLIWMEIQLSKTIKNWVKITSRWRKTRVEHTVEELKVKKKKPYMKKHISLSTKGCNW